LFTLLAGIQSRSARSRTIRPWAGRVDHQWLKIQASDCGLVSSATVIREAPPLLLVALASAYISYSDMKQPPGNHLQSVAA